MVRTFAAPSVRRLPSYLQVIRELTQDERDFISATDIALELQLEPIQVRKDLAMTGIIGTPKKGYPVADLIDAVERFLGWDSNSDAVLVGVGNLGSALLGHRNFLLHGLHIMVAFDVNPRKIGARIHGIHVFNAETMDIQIKKLGVKIAILTVPPEYAQKSADMLVGAGIEGIWNFTDIKLKVPGSVAVQQEDLSAGYALLRVKMKSRSGKEFPVP
ncbi:MAG: redox-sensing transcriptional repressor Rex [Treponema sp.]|jgi:redox-sensing transcriptional repressor|nr:redox-sensing transcriptional repressor Rex [Treponema sp.]